MTSPNQVRPGPNDEVWDTCFRQTVCVPGSEEPTDVVGEVFAPMPIKIDTKNRIVGNDRGLELIRHTRECEIYRREMQEMMDQMQNDFNHFKDKRNQFMSPLRSTVLDEWAGQKRDYLQNERNVATHGGDVVSDIQAVLYYGYDEDRVETWKPVFKAYYGMSFQQIKSEINEMPPKFISVINKRATVCSMHGWKKDVNSTRRSRIIGNTDRLISKWIEGNTDFVAEGTEIDEAMTEIGKEYDKGTDL